MVVKKKYNLAINIYSELIENNANDIWYIFYLRGICYEQSDNWPKAEKDFMHSLKLKRNSPNVLNYLAYGWIERDMKIDLAMEMLKKANEANPDSFYSVLEQNHIDTDSLEVTSALIVFGYGVFVYFSFIFCFTYYDFIKIFIYYIYL